MLPGLTKQELEQVRYAAQLYEWVHTTNDSMCTTLEDRQSLDLRKPPLSKEFRDEVWPLANYAKFFLGKRSDLRFKPVIGNQHYDALLLDESGATVCYFEITRAVEGHQERLQDEHRHKYGCASVFGPPLQRDRKTRQVEEAEPEFSELAKDVRKTIRLIEEAVKSKIKKAQKLSYPENTVLIVDYVGFHFANDAYQGELRRAVKLMLPKLPLCFSKLAIIERNLKRNLSFRYETQRKPGSS